MFLSFRAAKRLLLLQVVLLFIGTQIPGAWRTGLEAGLHAPFGLSSWAHFVLFTSMAWVAHSAPMNWSVKRVISTALLFALLTECFQFFAIDRHPRWLDVGIDMGGALLGLALAIARTKLLPARVFPE